jgi:hypothetical protein
VGTRRRCANATAEANDATDELPDEFFVVDLRGSSVFVFSARSAIRVTHPARSIDEISVSR